MKTNIERVDYKGRVNSNGAMYSWKTICDICGKECYPKYCLSPSAPNKEEKDYCLSCARLIADQKIAEKGKIINE